MTRKILELDDLRALVAEDGEDTDARVIAFYAWQNAAETVAAAFEDKRGREDLTDLIAGYMTGKFKPTEMSEVEEWLREFQDPEAIGGEADEIEDMVERWRETL